MWRGNLYDPTCRSRMILRRQGQFYRALSLVQQDHLVNNLSADLAGISHETRNIVLTYLHNASPEMGERIVRQIEMQTKG